MNQTPPPTRPPLSTSTIPAGVAPETTYTAQEIADTLAFHYRIVAESGQRQREYRAKEIAAGRPPEEDTDMFERAAAAATIEARAITSALHSLIGAPTNQTIDVWRSYAEQTTCPGAAYKVQEYDREARSSAGKEEGPIAQE
jgi:hypothetical protein